MPKPPGSETVYDRRIGNAGQHHRARHQAKDYRIGPAGPEMFADQLLRAVDEAEVSAENQGHANDVTDRPAVCQNEADVTEQFSGTMGLPPGKRQRFFHAVEIPC